MAINGAAQKNQALDYYHVNYKKLKKDVATNWSVCPNEADVCLKRKIIASMYYKNSDKCKAFRTMNTN